MCIETFDLEFTLCFKTLLGMNKIAHTPSPPPKNKKIFITKNMRIFYLNTTKQKSSKFIRGALRYLNFCEPKK